jgi:hypothetical protein
MSKYSVKILVHPEYGSPCWQYTNKGIMHPVDEIRNQPEMIGFVFDYKKASEVFTLICKQSYHRPEFAAVSLVEVIFSQDVALERAVVMYREFYETV